MIQLHTRADEAVSPAGGSTSTCLQQSSMFISLLCLNSIPKLDRQINLLTKARKHVYTPAETSDERQCRECAAGLYFKLHISLQDTETSFKWSSVDIITSSFASTLNQNIQTDVLFFCMIICEDGDFLRRTRSRLPLPHFAKHHGTFLLPLQFGRSLRGLDDRIPKRNRTRATHRTGCRVRASVYRLSGIKIKCRFIFCFLFYL